MVFNELPLKGAYLIELQEHQDQRGFFGRTFCKKEFAENGIDFDIVQTNLSFSKYTNTLRGMHYQVNGSEEKKLVKCMQGRILDVILDIRKDSPTFGQNYKVELSQENHLMLLVPEGFAHGFITLEPNCYLFYQVSNFYDKEKERAIRWNDPFYNIDWPTDNPILSERDASHPDFNIEQSDF